MVVGCCLSGVLGRRTTREGLRGPRQLLTISNCLLQVTRILDTVIWVDKIIFERIPIVVFVGVRGGCSARHHGGHVVRQCCTISRGSDSCWAGCTGFCRTCCAFILSPGSKAASSAAWLRQGSSRRDAYSGNCRRSTTVINLHMQTSSMATSGTYTYSMPLLVFILSTSANLRV